ncbi:MAG: hypothetical protein AB7J35_03120 [Dehalococcoidia bacterium]
MTTNSADQKFDWATIATMDQDGQNGAVTAAYAAIADQDEATRRESLSRAIESVYRMPDDQLRSMTEARLRAWLALPEDKAAVVGNSFESVMDTMPAEIAMRRVTVVQSVAFKLKADELEHLQHIVPRVLGDTPKVTATAAPAQPQSRPWWKFWAKA